MKTSLLTLAFALVCGSGFSQNLKFDLTKNNKQPVTKEKLSEAKLVSDVILDYPSLWIVDCISTELLGSVNGKTLSATGSGELLSQEQKNLLQGIDMCSDLTLKMNYTFKNGINNTLENDMMKYRALVVPTTEAEFPGGEKEMTAYLEKKAGEKIPETASKTSYGAIVRFTVNEDGEIASARILTPSQNKKVDALLLNAIYKMPKWKPAQNLNGTKVKQEFELRVGSAIGGSGC